MQNTRRAARDSIAESRRSVVGWSLVLRGVFALWLVAAMSACSSIGGLATSTATLNDRLEKLALGTLNLESTSQAVDAQTASTLLPLWQLADELQGNSSAAPQELTAVLDEIEASMDSAQLESIAAMKLDTTPAGGSGTAARSSSSGTQAASASASGGINAGMLAGMPPDMAGGPMGGGGPGPGSQGSFSASNNAQAGAGSGNTTAIQQVIQLLERKVQS